MGRLIPKGRSIHRISVGAKGADIGFRCGSSAEDEAMMKRGYMSRGSIAQTYPSRFVPKINEVSLGGAHVQGHSFIGFNLPGPSNCVIKRMGSRRKISCAFKSGSPSGFDGYKRRRKRRRR